MKIDRTAPGYQPANSVGGLLEPPVYEPAADIVRIVSVVRRQYKLALIGAAAGLAVALLLLAILTPSYKSSIRILLDQDRSKLLTEISGQEAPTSTEEYMATQIAVISSDIVARRVINALNLTYDPDERRLRIDEAAAQGDTDSKASRVSVEALDATTIEPAVVYAVQKGISVYQVDKSLVVEITANDPDPVLAQKIATAYGNAYLTDQLSARFDATNRAGSWLEERLTTLRQQSVEANTAVEQFRAENNLMAADGRLLSDKQLGDLNEQLATARRDATRASAKVEVLQDAVAKNDVDAIVGIVGATTEIPDGAPIKIIRSDYLEVAQRARDVAARWGEDNPQAKILQTEVSRQAGLVMAEVKRILESYRNDLRTAEREVQSTTTALETATGRSKVDNSTLVALRSLEQRSAASNALYQEYLARYQEAVQQQTLSLTTGRLISRAEVPSVPTFPNTKVIAAIMLVLGGGIGAGAGVGRELFDRTFRSRQDVERLGLDFLGYIADPIKPTLAGYAALTSRFVEAASRRFAGFSKWGRLFAKPGKAESPPLPDIISKIARGIARSKVTLSTVRTGIEIRRRGASRITAMISPEANPARSAIALALAMREAASGRRVLLIDADHTTGGISQTVRPPQRADSPRNLIVAPPSPGPVPVQLGTGLWFLSLGTDVNAGARTNLVSPEHLKRWGMEFDIVIADLPPAGPISEARMLAPAVDAFVCVVRWGKTPRNLLPLVVQSSPSIESKLVGIVIADVAMERQHLYDTEVARAERVAHA